MRTNVHIIRSGLACVVGLTWAGAVLGCGAQTFTGGEPLTVVGGTPPPPPPPRVEVTANKIVINEKIQFEFDKAVIRPESDDLLAEVAQTIKSHPEIRKIRVEGHASSDGEDRHNMELSDRRAKAVLEHLVTRGQVARDRLIAKGYGETQPIASNDTDEGREKNRRVEFTIIEQGEVGDAQ